jgi:hypothetical protein
MAKTKGIIGIIVIALVVALFIVWESQRWQQKPKTAEEIKKEIERLENLLKQIEEDTAKAKRGEVFCPLVYQPVCGKDGKTYSNSCFANAAGTEIAHKGECK